MTTPLGCARCGVRRVLHDADHPYQVPDIETAINRAKELRNRRAAA